MATSSVQAQELDNTPSPGVLQTGILGGRVRVAQVELNLEGESSGTTFELTDLPSNAVIQRIEAHQDASSTTNFDIGDVNKNDGIIDGQSVDQTLTLSMANQNGGTNGMGPADFQKQLWEVLGYSDRIVSGGNIRLQARNPSSSVGSGKLYFTIHYVVD